MSDVSGTDPAAELLQRAVADDGHGDIEGAIDAMRPEEPALPPREWVRKNLFSTPFNTVLTIVFVAIILAVVRGLLVFIFSAERQWDATATNLRLLMTQAYPEDQYVRVWVSVGIVVALGGLSVAAWQAGSRLTVHSVARRVLALGVTIAGVGVLAPFSSSATLAYVAVGLALVAAAVAAFRFVRDDVTISSLTVVMVAAAIPILSLWVVPYGHYSFVEGQPFVEAGTVATTTSLPWTLMLLLAIASYYVGTYAGRVVEAGRLRLLISLAWFISPVIITFIVLRDPDFDYAHIFSTILPILLAFAIGGGLLLFWLARPGVGEIGRVVAAVVLLAAAASFLSPMLQIVRILGLLLALFALAAPTFSGDLSARVRYVTVWVGVAAFTTWVVTAVNSPSTVESPGGFFTGGLAITVIVAVFTMILAFPLGVLLALARTSKMPLFRLMATTYIEFVRGVPLITILIFFSVMLPLFLPENMEISELAAVTIGFTLFSAAYLAENVRGGLQSIRRGQYEAAEALGMTTAQKTVFIVLPQALRVSIPPLVGQTIATFKETSLLAIIGVFDLLYIARSVIPNQSAFLGSTREQLIVVSLIYWAVSYSMSKASQRLERKLGVGER